MQPEIPSRQTLRKSLTSHIVTPTVTGIMRTSFMKVFAFALVAVLLAGSARKATADTVILKSGRTLEGAVTSEAPSEITLKTAVGMFTISRSDIRELRRSDRAPQEVDADAALAAGKLQLALEYYQTALRQVPAGSPAQTRLKERVLQVQQTIRQAQDKARQGQLQQATLYLQNNRLPEAQQLLTSLLGTMTDEAGTSEVLRLLAEVHFRNAEVARDRQNMLARRDELSSAVELYPDHVRARLALGDLLMEYNTTMEQGMSQIEQALASASPELAEYDRACYHYKLARRHFDRGDFQKAASHYAAALQVKVLPPECSDALDRAVESYVRMGEQSMITDTYQTIQNLRKALELNPQNKSALFLLGRIYRDTGQTGNAVEEFQKVIGIDPDFQHVHHALAQAYLDQNDYQKALTQLDLELEKSPRNYDALLDRAQTLLGQGSPDRAAVDVDAAIALESERWRGYLVKAQVETTREKYDEARKNLDQLRALKSDSVEAYIQTGRLAQAEKKYDEARGWFNEVVKALGGATAGNFTQRLQAAEAQTALGQIDLLQGNPRSAETRLRMALQIVPAYAPALSAIGDVRRILGADESNPATQMKYYQEALQNYQMAVEVNPRNPEYRLKIGVLYHKNIKDTGRAIIAYQEYLDLGGRDRTTVENWIAECGTPILTEPTTATLAAQTGDKSTTEMPGAAAPLGP